MLVVNVLLADELGVVRGGSGKHEDQLSQEQLTVYWKVWQQSWHVEEFFFLMLISSLTVDFRTLHNMANYPNIYQNFHFIVLLHNILR